MTNQDDIRRAWVAALRSGEYQQGKHQLRNGSEFCCLGVLCDIYGRAKGVEWGAPPHGNTYHFQMCDSLPPEEVQNFVGIRSPDCVQIAQLNDRDQLTFEQIADRLEEMFNKEQRQ